MAEQKKKIAMVVQRYGLEVNGGAELECRLYAERLSAGFDVTVITTCAVDHQTWSNAYESGEEHVNGVRVLRFLTDQPRDPDFNTIHTRLLTEKRELSDEMEWMYAQGPVSKKMIEYIEGSRQEYYAFVFMTYLYYSTICGLPAVADKSVLIPTAHDEPQIYFSIFREVFTSPKAIFYNSPSEQRFVQGLFSNRSIRSEIGGAGVDLPDDVETEGFSGRYKIDSPYIVYVGRIEESKGCRELFDYLDAYNERKISAKEKPLQLVLVGKSGMEIPVREYIRAIGFVSENDKYAAIKQSRFLVLPSHFESLSIVVLEAFALSKAVLVNGNCEVLADHCRSSNGGLYYRTQEEFFAYCDYLLDHPQAVKQMGQNGCRYQKKYYSWDSILSKLTDLIHYAAKQQ